MLLLIICIAFGSASARCKCSHADDGANVPVCSKKPTVHLCPFDTTVSKKNQLEDSIITNYCTGNSSGFDVGQEGNKCAKTVTEGHWPEYPITNAVEAPTGLRLGYLHFQRACFTDESVTATLNLTTTVGSAKGYVKITGIDKLDFLNARFQAPLQINGTDPYNKRATLLKVHHGVVGAKAGIGFQMEPGSAMVVHGSQSDVVENVSAVVTRNSLKVGAGSKVIVFGKHVLLEFKEKPNARLNDNVTICVIQPEGYPREHPEYRETDRGLKKDGYPKKLVVTLKDGATSDMMSDYIYLFVMYTVAYEGREIDELSYQVPAPMLGDPKNFSGITGYFWMPDKPAEKDRNNAKYWVRGDSFGFHRSLAIHKNSTHPYDGIMIYDWQYREIYNRDWQYRGSYNICSELSDEVEKTLKEIKKDDKTCNTSPTPGTTKTTTASTTTATTTTTTTTTTTRPELTSARTTTITTNSTTAPPGTANWVIILVVSLVVLTLCASGTYYKWRSKQPSALPVDGKGEVAHGGQTNLQPTQIGTTGVETTLVDDGRAGKRLKRKPSRRDISGLITRLLTYLNPSQTVTTAETEKRSKKNTRTKSVKRSTRKIEESYVDTQAEETCMSNTKVDRKGKRRSASVKSRKSKTGISKRDHSTLDQTPAGTTSMKTKRHGGDKKVGRSPVSGKGSKSKAARTTRDQSRLDLTQGGMTRTKTKRVDTSSKGGRKPASGKGGRAKITGPTD